MRARQFLKVMLDFNFLLFPRSVGTPEQRVCNNPEALLSFYKTNNGRGPCFISHNSYPGMGDDGVPKDVLVTNLFFDFDSDKPENALLDAMKLSNFFSDNFLPHAITYSGKKGFHVYLFLNPEKHQFDQNLRLKTIAVHRWLAGQLKLKTLDPRVAEPRRLCRIPLSKNTGEGGRYCVPLSRDMIHEMDFLAILDYADAPRIPDGYMNLGDLLNFSDLLAEYNIGASDYAEAASHGPADLALYEERPGPYSDYIRNILPDPCIHSELMSHNPRHLARVAACVHLRRAGFTIEEATDEFNTISETYKWVDRHNQDTRRYHIESIYRGDYRYPTCTRIRYDYGLCIGPVCPKYRRYFSDADSQS